jgi:hypothetical protein
MDGRHARAVLGVPAQATADDIRQAFRRRALATHPDRGGDRTSFELVVLAFETLQHVTVSAPISAKPSVEPAAPLHPRFSSYDCRRAPRPARQFDDVLRAAVARTR